MAIGIFIKTFPLTGYPAESQILMKKIAEDFEKNQFSVTQYKGSYSILNDYGKTIVKILCTIGSNVTIGGTGVVVLFKAEHINNFRFEKIVNNYPSLDMRKVLYKVGAGKYEDFYLVKIESDDVYKSKSFDILNLLKLLIDINFYQ